MPIVSPINIKILVINKHITTFNAVKSVSFISLQLAGIIIYKVSALRNLLAVKTVQLKVYYTKLLHHFNDNLQYHKLINK